MSTAVAPRIEMVSTPSSLTSFSIINESYGPLCIDLEGKDLCRHGSISIISIFSPWANTVWLFNIKTLGPAAFTERDAAYSTLKDILQDSYPLKYFWDVRNDADALWAIYNVNLGGVIDVQLLENASRTGNKRTLSGLAMAIQYDAKLRFVERERWLRVKREITDMMRHDIFSQRPLEEKTIQYCANDVIHLPKLASCYKQRINREWLEKALAESDRRVVEAQSPSYNPQSPTKFLGPWAGYLDPRSSSVDNNTGRETIEPFQIGFYDDDDIDYDADYPRNAHEGAWDSEAFYSCWDKN